MSKSELEEKVVQTSAEDAALTDKPHTDTEKLEVATKDVLDDEKSSLHIDEKKDDEHHHSHINFDGEKLSYLQEPKINLAEDWNTIKAELNEIWQPLSAEEEKTVDFEAQIAHCRDLRSRWVFRQTPQLESFFSLRGVLGNPGQYGVVKEAVGIKGYLEGKKVAVKAVSKLKYKKVKVIRSFFADLRNEVRLMRASGEHPHVIEIYVVFEDIQNLYIVMEYCCGGELFDRITSDGVGSKNFNEKKASEIVGQIISAVYHVHSLSVAHCDLKPENFIFTDDTDKARLKLIDFGMAKVVHWRKYHRRMNGTPYYIAPEVLKGKYNEACDMWSVGVIMFIIIFGFPPFHDHLHCNNRKDADKVIYGNVKRGFTPKVKPDYGPWFPEAQPVSSSCKDLIARLLRLTVADRMTSEEAMFHPWIRGDKLGGSLSLPMQGDIQKSMRYFHRNCQLQSEILLVLKDCKYLSTNQENAVISTFKMMDKEGHGHVTKDELYDTLLKVDPHITKEECQTIMLCVDANSNGVIEYDELLATRINRKLISKEERLRKVFKCLDTDGSRTLTPDEVLAALSSIHKDITPAECKELMKDADTNHDGMIDYEEWLAMFGKA